MVSLFNNKRNQIIIELRKISGRFSLTADMWTSTINREAFLGLTIHYIDYDWKLHHFLLDIIPFTVSHTGMNIAHEIMRVLDEFDISSKIIALTTDNESAMLVCGEEIALALNLEFSNMIFSHYRCAAHVLNLGAKKGLKLVNESINKTRKVMKTIKNSTRLCDSLRILCNLKKIKYLKPILDCDTRWNSTFYMLKRLKELEPALNLLSTDNVSIGELYPNSVDMAAIKVKGYY
jgi:hypothetical protein